MTRGGYELRPRAPRLQRAALAEHVLVEQLDARADRFSDLVFERDHEGDDAERIERAAGADDDGSRRLLQPPRRRQLLIDDVDRVVHDLARLFAIHHGCLAADDSSSPSCRALRLASSCVNRIPRFERIVIWATT